ncbi:bifunctional metallophosphatase/5'-nucleotidase [Congregibacter sp.]|uniref:bifunctional metallophosphatase/5'-nucleotidase n=1 Tax=Congregibacter sp. TaxID=2744308 RepID=UPI003F6D6527
MRTSICLRDTNPKRQLRSHALGLFVYLLGSVLGSNLSFADSRSPDAQAREITLLFTNDFESAYDPIDAFWRDDTARIGGIAHVATLIETIRDKNERVLLLDAGDIFTGTLARRTRGAVAFDLMQMLRYDAMAIGNHEFEYGWESFAAEKARAPFPVLGANLFYAGTEHPYSQPWTIIERKGVRVGIIGLMGQDAATALIPSNIAGLDVRNPTEILHKHVAHLRAEVDLIVVLIHQGPTAPMQTDDEADPRVFRGNKENIALAGAVPGVDVILAGHTDAGTPQALVHPLTGTLIMQTWGQGQHVGQLNLKLNNAGEIVEHDSQLLTVDAERYLADPDVTQRLADWRASQADLNDIVGHTASPIVRRYYDESPLGNLFADIARRSLSAQVGLMPSGALRRDLPKGDVRREELIDAFPFEDRLALVTLSGAALLAILEQGFSLERGLLQVSGIEVAYAPDKPVGSRVTGVCIDGRPMQSTERYEVATVEILAKGGDAYSQFAAADSIELLEIPFAKALETAFAKAELVESPPLGRLVANPGPKYACSNRSTQ